MYVCKSRTLVSSPRSFFDRLRVCFECDARRVGTIMNRRWEMGGDPCCAWRDDRVPVDVRINVLEGFAGRRKGQLTTMHIIVRYKLVNPTISSSV